MTLQDDKTISFEKVVIGESIHLSEMDTVLVGCSVYHHSVALTNNDVFVRHLAGTNSQSGTLIISLDKAPVRTKRRSSQIMSDFKKKYCPDHTLFKKLSVSIFEKQNYYCPYMTGLSAWLPLEGESRGDVDYLNLSGVESIDRLPSGESLLCFVNHFEVTLHQDFYTLRKKIKRHLLRYAAVFLSLSQLNYLTEEMKPFARWRGLCGFSAEELLQEVFPKINMGNLRFIKTVYELNAHLSLEESRKRLIEIYDKI